MPELRALASSHSQVTQELQEEATDPTKLRLNPSLPRHSNRLQLQEAGVQPPLPPPLHPGKLGTRQ